MASAATASTATSTATPTGSTLKVFGHATTADIAFDKEVVTVSSAATVEEAFRVLGKAHILSAPVVDKDSKAYLGFIDIADLVSFTSGLYKVGTVVGSALPTYFTSLRNLLGRTGLSLPTKIPTLVNLSKNNPFIPVAPDTTLLQVFGLLAIRTKDGASIHRVPVVDPKTNKITKIISQSSAIQLMHKNIDSIGEVADKTLKDLGLATCAVVSVGTKEPALRAFELMAEHNFSAIPLVDASGKLFTNISNSDVRYMVTIDKLELVGMDALSYVAACRQADTSNSGRTMAVSITCHPSDPLRKVIAKLAATRVHRLYVIGEADTADAGKPVGVVSLRDILGKVVVEPAKAAGAQYVPSSAQGFLGSIGKAAKK